MAAHQVRSKGRGPWGPLQDLHARAVLGAAASQCPLHPWRPPHAAKSKRGPWAMSQMAGGPAACTVPQHGHHPSSSCISSGSVLLPTLSCQLSPKLWKSVRHRQQPQRPRSNPRGPLGTRGSAAVGSFSPVPAHSPRCRPFAHTHYTDGHRRQRPSSLLPTPPPRH